MKKRISIFQYPRKVRVLTCIILLFICRKTIFDVSKEVGEYAASLDSSTTLALAGIVIGFLFIFTHLKAAKVARIGMWPILAYSLFAWASFMWAGNGTTITFKSLEHIVNIYLVGMIAYYIKDSRKMLYYIIVLATLSTYLCVFDFWMDRGLGWYHTNSYTFSSMIGLILAVGCVKNEIFTFREMRWFIFLDFIAWLLGTSSASYIAALIGFLVLFASGRKGLSVIRILLISIGLYLLFLTEEDAIYKFLIAGHTQGELETGTGRMLLWEAAFERWKTAPLLGHGFIIGETTLGDYGQISAHNSWISALVNTGVVGLFFFTWFVLKWILKAFKESKMNVYASVTFPAIIAILLNLSSCPVLASHWSYVSDSVYAVIAATFMVFVKKTESQLLSK